MAQIILLVPPQEVAQGASLLQQGEYARVSIAPGGLDRAASVRRGLAQLRQDITLVLVHDAARCLAPVSLFHEVIEALRAGHEAVVPGLPVADTIKQVDLDGVVVATVERAHLRAIQTPQGFTRRVLNHAHTVDPGAHVTDDAGLVEATGVPVRVIPGDARALKITTPHDLRVAAALLATAGGQA